MANYRIVCNGELYHHGIRGQKWGIRRFQDENGRLTPEGLRRYIKKKAKEDARQERKERRKEKLAKAAAVVTVAGALLPVGFMVVKAFSNKPLPSRSQVSPSAIQTTHRLLEDPRVNGEADRALGLAGTYYTPDGNYTVSSGGTNYGNHYNVPSEYQRWW